MSVRRTQTVKSVIKESKPITDQNLSSTRSKKVKRTDTDSDPDFKVGSKKKQQPKNNGPRTKSKVIQQAKESKQKEDNREPSPEIKRSNTRQGEKKPDDQEQKKSPPKKVVKGTKQDKKNKKTTQKQEEKNKKELQVAEQQEQEKKSSSIEGVPAIIQSSAIVPPFPGEVSDIDKFLQSDEQLSQLLEEKRQQQEQQELSNGQISKQEEQKQEESKQEEEKQNNSEIQKDNLEVSQEKQGFEEHKNQESEEKKQEIQQNDNPDKENKDPNKEDIINENRNQNSTIENQQEQQQQINIDNPTHLEENDNKQTRKKLLDIVFCCSSARQNEILLIQKLIHQLQHKINENGQISFQIGFICYNEQKYEKKPLIQYQFGLSEIEQLQQSISSAILDGGDLPESILNVLDNIANQINWRSLDNIESFRYIIHIVNDEFTSNRESITYVQQQYESGINSEKIITIFNEKNIKYIVINQQEIQSSMTQILKEKLNVFYSIKKEQNLEEQISLILKQDIEKDNIQK